MGRVEGYPGGTYNGTSVTGVSRRSTGPSIHTDSVEGTLQTNGGERS